MNRIEVMMRFDESECKFIYLPDEIFSIVCNFIDNDKDFINLMMTCKIF